MEYGSSALNAVGFVLMSWLFRQGALDHLSAHPFGLYGLTRVKALVCIWAHYIFALLAVVFLMDSVFKLGIGTWQPL